MAGRPMPIDSPPPPEALSHEISDTFQTPPRRGSDPVPPDYDRQYQTFVKLVRQLKKDQISISELSLLLHAEACLAVEISSETSRKDVAKQFVERYNAESIPTEAHPAFSRGDLSIKAEKISRMLLQTIPVPFTHSQWNSLRRAYALSVFGIVSAPCFRNLPGSLNQDERLDVANDPITYKRSEDILVPTGIKLENIHSYFRSDCNDNDTRFFWLLAIRTLHEFVPTSICLPEEQFVAGLWSPLLQSCLRIDVVGTVRLTPTFQLKMTDVVPGLKSERFIDLAYHLKSLPGCPELDRAVRIPILMVEVSAYEVPHDYDHKDFRKLSACMAAALVALLGIARGLTKDQKEKLRLFGMFVGGHSCIPCVMVPVEVDSNRASFVFYCDPGKQFNLLGSEREPIPPAARQEFISEPVHYDPTSLPTLEELEAATAKSLKEKGIREQSCESLNADELASRLRPLVAFCSTINTYATFLHQVLLDLRPPQEPYPMWKDAAVLPKSRTEHKRSTPAPEKRTIPSTNPSKRSREVRMQHIVDADGSTTVIKEKPQSCRKEADLLGAAQGDGIVVLKGFEVPSGTCSGGCILYEELLEVVDLSTLTSAEMGLLLIRLIIDGLSAIETLRSAGIVHRDISPNNIMYSFEAQAWRLTDFDSAEYLSCAKASCLIGTEGYIAPESTACGDYSHASDLWSLGRTISYFTTCIENELWCRDGEPDELDIEDLLLRSQTQICLRLLDEDPALRVIAPADQQFLSVGHTFFENWVARTVVDDRAKRIRPRSPPTSKRRRRSLCHPRGEALLDPDQQTIVSADCLQSTTTQVQ